MPYAKTTVSGKVSIVLTGILLLLLGLAGCATRLDAPEPEIKVRGQYEFAIGTVR